jgi:hypothetical protein
MELNGGAGTFTDCVAQRCGVGTIDLQNTVTHEAGHLLGLAHSSVAGATMEAAAFTGPETQKRSLAQDDEQGYCALSLPPHSCTGTGCVCPPPPIYPSSSGGCSCQLTQRATPKLALSAGAALLGLIGLWRGRVVRRRGPPPPRAP